MKSLIALLAAFFALFIFLTSANAQSAKRPDRQVAITIDDLPAGMSDRMPASTITAMTAKLLGTLRDQKIPVVGFVNGKKIYKTGETDERIKALQMWLDYGFDLGNHTYSHMSLNQAGLKAWEDDVVEGESVLNFLLAPQKKHIRYFRHPFLDTGRDLVTRRESEAFLTQRGYRIAPVTLDGWDWMYAGLYEDALDRNDAAGQQQLVKAYLEHHEEAFAYSEKLSVQTLGYEPKQILLLHASRLEADHIGELLELLRKRGYRFISLEDALGDQAYSLPDDFVGEEGSGWIEHWAITQGKIPQGSPEVQQWVMDKTKNLGLSTGIVTPPNP